MFSELALFLFGSGLALFIALLGWSDQIRSTNKESQELEKRFLETHDLRGSDLAPVIRPTSPDKQLEALTNLVISGKLKVREDVEALPLFQQWNEQRSVLEKYYSVKYNLTLLLTLSFFAAGVQSLFVDREEVLVIGTMGLDTEMVIVAAPMAILALISGLIIATNAKERSFNELLISISDRV